MTKLFWIVVFLPQLQAAPNAPRSSVLVPEWSQYSYHEPTGKGTYSFGYDVEDPETNNIQYRSEERHANGTVIGSYGYLEPDGNIHMVHYIADEQGYRATVENSARGGMLKPIPVLGNGNHIAYGYSPQMLAAIQSQKIYNRQKIHEQRERPFDQLSEEEKLHFRPNGEDNKISSGSRQIKLQEELLPPFTKAFPTPYSQFNYGNLLEKNEDNLDYLALSK